MNKKLAAYFFLFISWQVYSIPVSTSSFQIEADISVDFYTKSEVSTSSLWYRTVMPEYRLGCIYSYLSPENQFHYFEFGFKYFESNTFSLNTKSLESGDMRSIKLGIYGLYNRYLPIVPNFDYITGVSLSGIYNSFGQVITDDGAKINELYYLKIGPVNGFSFNLKDKLEIKSLLFLNIGIPVSGNISYPSDVDKDVLPVNLSLSLYTEVSVTLRRIQLSLYHEWSHSFNLLLEDSLDTFTPAAASSENLHRIGLKFGINL